MESFQPLLGGAATTQQNNENRVNVNNNTTSYGSLKNQSNSSLSNSNNREGNGLSVPQSPLLTSGGRLPPIPSRQRAHSSDDRSIVSDVSTLSGRSGGGLGASQRGHRSKSPVPGNSGNYGGGAPPKAPHPLMGGHVSSAGNQQQSNVFRPHPLLRSASTTSARGRTNSNDGTRPPIRRQSSSGSVFSISSQESGASMTQETLKLLPDPRWGGGSGANRARSFSSGSHQRRNTFSNFSGGGSDFDYGSLQGLTFTNLAPPAGGGKKKHRRSDSAASYASVISVDQSIDPVTTNMSKSSMFKEVTNKGVVRMQLPKDQFRLLSDRDLGKYSYYIIIFFPYCQSLFFELMVLNHFYSAPFTTRFS